MALKLDHTPSPFLGMESGTQTIMDRAHNFCRVAVMGSRLYLLGVALILVAVGYQYRDDIQRLVTGATRTSAPKKEPPGRPEVFSDSGQPEIIPGQGTPPKTEPRAPTKSTPTETLQTSEQSTLTPAESNAAGSQTDAQKIDSKTYYNPPFDPTNAFKLFSKSGTRLITLNELAAHGHSGPLKPIWLAIAGKVFDVDKGAEHYYGPKGGYNFFTGRDGTKAFVTGEFDEDGLTDDLEGLSPLQLGEIENWVKFYTDDYTYVGKLIGRYYNKDGSPTKEWYKYNKLLGEQEKIKAEQKAQEKRFPGCNSKWTEQDGGNVYCSEKR